MTGNASLRASAAYVLLWDGEVGRASAFPLHAKICSLNYESRWAGAVRVAWIPSRPADDGLVASASLAGAVVGRSLDPHRGLWSACFRAQPFVALQARGLARPVAERSADLVVALFTLLTLLRKIDGDSKVLGTGWRERSFAATGTLDVHGRVGSVEFVPAKMDAALQSHAWQPGDVVLVPREDWPALVAARPRLPELTCPRVLPVDSLQEALEALEVPLPVFLDGNPYPGLAPYSATLRLCMVGRQEEVRQISAWIETQRQLAAGAGGVLALVGASGAGKSSLLRAGLWPMLQAPWKEACRAAGGQATELPIWDASACPDGTEAATARSLAESWRATLPLLDPETIEQIDDFDGLVLALSRALPEHGVRPFWALDQMEALARGAGDEGIPLARWSDLLQALAGLGVWTLCTVRRERIHAFDDDDWLRQSLRQDWTVRALVGEAQLREVVCAPVALAGLSWESGLAQPISELMVRDALSLQGNALPFLCLALQLMCAQGIAAGDGVLTLAAYERLGGLQGLIGRHAEAVFQSASPAEQEALPMLLRGLSAYVPAAGGIVSRALPVTTLSALPAARRLARRLLGHRLLTHGPDGAHLQLRVAHEALLRDWPRAHALLMEEQALLALRDELQQQALQWEQGEGDLLSAGVKLDRALNLLASFPDEMDALLRRYVQSSDHRQQAEASLWTQLLSAHQPALAALELMELSLASVFASLVAHRRQCTAVVGEGVLAQAFLRQCLRLGNPQPWADLQWVLWPDDAMAGILQSLTGTAPSLAPTVHVMPAAEAAQDWVAAARRAEAAAALPFPQVWLVLDDDPHKAWALALALSRELAQAGQEDCATVFCLGAPVEARDFGEPPPGPDPSPGRRPVPLVLAELGRSMDRSRLLDRRSLGKAIHEHYLAHCLATGETLGVRPSLQPWAQLPLEFQLDCEYQAQHHAFKLLLAGRSTLPTAQGASDALDAAEVEAMARLEHSRWAISRLLAGWRWGPVRDDARKLHPDLEPYDALTEPIKNKDRQAIWALPDILARTGHTLAPRARG